MKALKVWIVLACSAVGIALAGPARAQDAEFQLSFCNMSAFSNVMVAVTRRQDAQRWLVEGWYPIPEDGCAIVGSFLRDTIYYYAYGQTNDGRIVTWSPPATDTTAAAQCVDLRQVLPSAIRWPVVCVGSGIGALQADQDSAEQASSHMDPDRRAVNERAAHCERTSARRDAVTSRSGLPFATEKRLLAGRVVDGWADCRVGDLRSQRHHHVGAGSRHRRLKRKGRGQFRPRVLDLGSVGRRLSFGHARWRILGFGGRGDRRRRDDQRQYRPKSSRASSRSVLLKAGQPDLTTVAHLRRLFARGARDTSSRCVISAFRALYESPRSGRASSTRYARRGWRPRCAAGWPACRDARCRARKARRSPR